MRHHLYVCLKLREGSKSGVQKVVKKWVFGHLGVFGVSSFLGVPQKVAYFVMSLFDQLLDHFLSLLFRHPPYDYLVLKKVAKVGPEVGQKPVIWGSQKPRFWPKMAIFGPKPPGVVRGWVPPKNPLFGVFWKSAKKPSFLALNLGHLKKAKKRGHFWVFSGGSKMAILEKWQNLMAPESTFFSIFCKKNVCFFVIFWHFLEVWEKATSWDPLFSPFFEPFFVMFLSCLLLC